MSDLHWHTATGINSRGHMRKMIRFLVLSFSVFAFAYLHNSANAGELVASKNSEAKAERKQEKNSKAKIKAAKQINTDVKVSDEQVIRQQAEDYAKAFSNADVLSLTAMWADDATFTDQTGHIYNGRSAIQNQMTAFFEKFGKQPFEIKIDSLEFPAANLAIEHGVTHIGTSKNPMTFGVYTAVHVKRDGKWQMVSVAETPKVPDSVLNGPDINRLSWLVGTWNVEGPRGNLQIKADWVADKRMIRCDFNVNTKDGQKNTQTQFIYVDPLFKKVRSWQYDSSGGYGESRWFNSGSDWLAEGCAVEADGSTGSARYLIKKIDDNTFSWQSTSRKIQGQSLPDTPVLTAKRVAG